MATVSVTERDMERFLPVFRRNRDGSLALHDSPGAEEVKAKCLRLKTVKDSSGDKSYASPRPQSVVMNNAVKALKHLGGDDGDITQLLGQFTLEFGTYRNMSFKWLLENALGYVGYLVATTELELDANKNVVRDANWLNKMSIRRYLNSFEEGKQAVALKKKEKKPKGTVQSGKELNDVALLAEVNAMENMEQANLVHSTTKPRQQTAKNSKLKADNQILPGKSNKGTLSATSFFSPVLSSKTPSSANLVHSTTKPGQQKDKNSKLTADNQTLPGPSNKGSSSATSFFSPVLSSKTPSSANLVHSTTKPGQQKDKNSKLTADNQTLPGPSNKGSSSATSFFSPVLSSKTPSSVELESSTADLTFKTPNPEVTKESQLPPAELTFKTSNPEVAEELQTTSTEEEVPLYSDWRTTLPAVDHKWVSKQFFRQKGSNVEFKLEIVDQLWYYPPAPSLTLHLKNQPDRFFAHRMFMWMPVNIWEFKLNCPHKDEDGQLQCPGILNRSGMHKKTRMVLDIDSYYIIATECLSCSKCKRRVISWSDGVLDQLDLTTRSLFPCLLTQKYACDFKIIRLLRQRTLGNSSSMLKKQVEEEHGEVYSFLLKRYLTECIAFKTYCTKPMKPPKLVAIPGHRWFMKIYQLDVIQRLSYIRASITSQFGDVLKIDSTKKITKKLAGKARKTAMWATNVGNEYGQIVMSVMTEGEGGSLQRMMDGLEDRYTNAQVNPPKVIYVDRDCCGNGSIRNYFRSWDSVNVRLDIWHFMRRIPQGCTTDKHPLYSVLMGRLSRCIFSIDVADMHLLKLAKRAQMMERCIPDPSEKDVIDSISSDEIKLHCKRITRGTKETVDLISNLIQSLDGENGYDTLGVPLFDSVKIAEVWKVLSTHVSCIQDPVGIQLYTKTGELKKGGVTLPVYRCARGSTSLESFHLHMNRFIPGTLANDVNFQVYLIDGIFRWNEDRKHTAVESMSKEVVPRTYSGSLKSSINKLYKEVFNTELFKDYKPPTEYTGELIGIEYLYSQTGKSMATADYGELVRQLDEDGEGPEEGDEEIRIEMEPEEELVEDQTVPVLEPVEQPRQMLDIPTQEEYAEMATDNIPDNIPQQITSNQTVPDASLETNVTDTNDRGPDNVPGYRAVLNLAAYLVDISDEVILSEDHINNIRGLWCCLGEFDRKRTKWPKRHKKKSSGKFRSHKKLVTPGVESLEKAVLGPNSTPASWPNCNRYTEAIIEKLMTIYRGDVRQKGKTKKITRWELIQTRYSKIAKLVTDNTRVMSITEMALPLLNKTTIQQWSNKKDKALEKLVLQQGLRLPQPPLSWTTAPQAMVKPSSLPSGAAKPFQFTEPKSTAGMANIKRRLHQRPRFILPTPGSSVCPVQLSPMLPVELPQMATLVQPDGQLGVNKRKADEQQGVQPKRPYHRKSSEPSKCSECKEPSIPPIHQRYCGRRYCGNKATITADQWRAILIAKGVKRKSKLSILK